MQKVYIGKTIADVLKNLEVIVDPTKEVFIKPNLCCDRPEATTDPKIVEEVIHFLRRVGAKNILIVESDNIGGSADKHFKSLGYLDLAERNKVRLINLTTYAKEHKLDPFAVPDIIINGQVVSINNMKTNDIGYVSLAGKNLLGLYPTPRKPTFHKNISLVIKKLIEQIRCILAIIDGYRGMDGPGSPLTGRIKNLGIVVGGTDIISVDYVCAKIMNIPHRLLGYLPENVKVEVLGEDIENLKTPFILPKTTIKNRIHYFVASHKILFKLFNRYIETW